MAWDKIRKEYQDRINQYQKNIDYNLKRWAETGSVAHHLFVEHDIKQLNDLKNYIIQKEKEQGLY